MGDKKKSLIYQGLLYTWRGYHYTDNNYDTAMTGHIMHYISSATSTDHEQLKNFKLVIR